jgi:hypothetical protein
MDWPASACGALAGQRVSSPTHGPAAELARADIQAIFEQRGHAVDNARMALARLEAAFAQGALVRTAELDRTIADLRLALEQDEGQKLGGKSAEAARFIARTLLRQLEEA